MGHQATGERGTGLEQGRGPCVLLHAIHEILSGIELHDVIFSFLLFRATDATSRAWDIAGKSKKSCSANRICGVRYVGGKRNFSTFQPKSLDELDPG